MNHWFYFALFMTFFCAGMYLLYRRGIAITENKRAILFIFRPGKNTDRANINSCTGWVRHIGRFHESRIYQFVLDARLSNGETELCLLDRKKQPLLKLNQHCPTGTIKLDAKNKYYLRWEFQNATGKCELSW